MTPFIDWSALDASLASTFGQSVTYSRPGSSNFDAVAPFALTVIVNTGAPYTDPLGPLAASIFVPSAVTAIPLGPQKGDLILITPGFNNLASGTYRVQEIKLDSGETSAHLEIRWSGQ